MARSIPYDDTNPFGGYGTGTSGTSGTSGATGTSGTSGSSSIGTGGQFRSVTTVNTVTYSLLITDYILHVTYTVTGASEITIPTAQIVDNRIIHIADGGANAGTNNITIATEGSETINGDNTLVISSDHSAVSLYVKDGNLFIY